MTTKSDYDVIIVGAGAGGGVAAGVLAEAGKKVLLLERGRPLLFEEVGRDHLRNQRNARYGYSAGPNRVDSPRVWIDLKGERHVGSFQENAACVGSGTRVYGGQAWRFMPQDFRMARTYGVPDGSSLADWPISYEDLEPYYEQAEWEIGVAADRSGMTHLPAGAREYPMPPVSETTKGRILKRAADGLGWKTTAVPLAINSVPRGGRDACIHCQHCVGFACPTDAKNGTQNTMIPRALRTGRCDLVTGAMVATVETDSAGRVTGVAYFDENGASKTARAEVVVLAGGAIETARLLLASRSAAHPDGIGNAHDQVGRSLQGHYYPTAVGLMPEPHWDGVGPGASVATCQFNHGNDGVIGGAMLADDFIVLPIVARMGMVPPDVPRWGIENKRWMRENYTRFLDIKGPLQEIPSPDARVTIDPEVRDRWGLPVARLSGATHPETVRTAQFIFERAREWLAAAGATKIWGNPPPLALSGGQHQAGTCRMSDDPRTGVVDRHCRVHGHDNLYIADGSVHVTNGGFNPVLTIFALAFRTAAHAAKNW